MDRERRETMGRDRKVVWVSRKEYLVPPLSLIYFAITSSISDGSNKSIDINYSLINRMEEKNGDHSRG